MKKRPRLHAVPITIKATRKYITKWHRHHRPPSGGIFAVAVAREGEEEPCGVAVVGRPPARLFDPTGMSAEITRIATDGTPGANSKLYALCRRIAGIMGYSQITTITLPRESGATMRAVGFENEDAKPAGGGRWSREGRERADDHPLERKLRWTEEL